MVVADRAGTCIDRLSLLIYASLVIKLYSMRVADVAHDPGRTFYVDAKLFVVGVASHVFLAVGLISICSLISRSRTTNRVLAVAVHVALLALAYLDFISARYQGFHISYIQLAYAAEGWNALPTLISFVDEKDLLLLADLPIIMMLARQHMFAEPPFCVRPTAVLFAIFVAAGYNLLHVTVVGLREEDPFRWHTHTASLPYTSRKFTYPVRWGLNVLFYTMLPDRQYGPPTTVPDGLPEPPDTVAEGPRPHLLLIQVESLAGGAFEWDFNGQAVMPFMRSLISRGVYFPNALTTRMTGGSFDADVAVLTGFHPPPTSNAYGYRFEKPPYFPHLLRRAGYATYTYDNHVPEFMKSEANHQALGIGRFYSIRDREWETRSGRIMVTGPGDREFLGWVRDRVLVAEGPGFFFVRTVTSHGPYLGFGDEPEIRNTIGHPFDGDPVLAGYAAALRYVDVSLQEMFRPLWPMIDRGELIVVVYGDHGAGVPIRSDGLPGLTRDDSARQNVPLLILGSELSPAVRKEMVSLQDIPLTLASLLHLTFAKGDLGGRNLLGPDRLSPLVTPSQVFEPSGPRPPSPDESELLLYGYQKLGAPY